MQILALIDILCYLCIHYSIFNMKIAMTIAFAAMASISFSQSEKRISYISRDRDTLVLPDSELGMRIFSAWSGSKDRPAILFAAESEIARMNKMEFIGSPIRKGDAFVSE